MFSFSLTWKKVFYGWLVVQVFAYLMSISKALDRFDPFYRAFDVFFIIYICIIIMGIIAMIRLLKFYNDFGSPEFLIMAFGVLGFSTVFFFYQLTGDFIFNIPFADATLQEPWLHLFGISYVYLGYYSVLYVAIRSRPWESYSIPSKGLIGLAVYQAIVNLLSLWEAAIVGFVIKGENPFFYVGFFGKLNVFYIIGMFYNPNLPIIWNDFLIWIPIIYIFSTIKVTNETRETKIARIVWISIAVLMLLVRVSSDIIQKMVYDISDPTGYVYAYNIWGIGTFIMVGIISITLSIIPEALMLSNQQILRANKLYQFVDQPPELEEDYISRIYQYIQDLPEDLKKEIKSLKSAAQ